MIALAGVSKAYGATTVLTGVDLAVEAGAMTLVTGPSGSGKTSLLNLMSALDRPDAGSVTVGDLDLTRLRARDLTRYRAALGLVFQRSGLLAGLTARENILVGHRLTGARVDDGWVSSLAARLGVDRLLDRRAGALSGGQAQRVAVVRALAHRPELVLADEPTAAVDSEAKAVIHDVLRSLVDEHSTTVVVVSHDELSASYADVTVRLLDGAILQEGP